jgi:hypothetical protein
MSAPAQIDYDALAAQHGGTAAIDYDALAAQHGGTAASTPPPTATISAVHEPDSLSGKVENWARNVASDIKYGSDLTGVGSVLKKMGAHGVYSGNPEAVGDFMASLPLGLAKMTQGAGETGQGKIVQGVKDVGSGALQAATIPASFVAPEAAEGTASAISNAIDKVNPSAMKEAAGGLLQSVAHDANKVPVSLDNAGDAALKLMDWQKKTQLGPTLNKFLNRITNPKLGPMTYEEGRDFYSLLSRMSADEQLKMAAPVKYQVQQLTAGLRQDIGNSAETVGRAADYYKGLGDYAKAARLQDWYDTAKTYAVRGALAAAGGGAASAGGKMIYDAMQDH